MFDAFLNQHDRAGWARTLAALSPSMHEVDRAATEIWFHFFPLGLAQAFAGAEDAAGLARELRLDGAYRLNEQHDTSHWFLYGHRYWPQAKTAVIRRAGSTTAPASLELSAIVREIAADAAAAAGTSEALILGITAVAVMTLQQIGLVAFRAESGPADSADLPGKPDQIVAARQKDDRQGLAGLFRGVHRHYSVRFDERRADARFPLINGQHLTTAAANDPRDYSSAGPRACHEGPIPVQCRTASCGTCWVGVLGGAAKLSEVDALETRRMKEFGYLSASEGRPVIRLACMARASGNVTIVIPPWNGFLGKRGLGN